MSRRTLLATGWSILLLALCLMPASWLPRREDGYRIPHVDKAVHFTLFAVFGALWVARDASPTRLRAVAAAGVALALLTELAQGIPAIARDPDVLDFAADVAGLAAALLVQKRRGPRVTAELPDPRVAELASAKP